MAGESHSQSAGCAANVSKVLHAAAETVVYSHMLDTSKWTLHPIELSKNSMTETVGTMKSDDMSTYEIIMIC